MYKENEKGCRCLYGEGNNPDNCGHCLENGACDAIYYPSNPPKYNKCPFHGEGFVEVDEKNEEN